MSTDPVIFLITGVMAAGKSTVAQELASRFAKSVHVRGDSFRRAIVSGRQDMTADPSIEALVQLRLRYELAAVTAERYASAGFTTVVQDIVIGPMLEAVVALYDPDALKLVVLCPAPEVVAQREAERSKTGYGGVTINGLDEELRERTPRLGYWRDNGDESVDETVEAIIEHFGISNLR